MNRVQNFLACSSIITKAANDFEVTAWLSYDTHFCTLAATVQLQTWTSPCGPRWAMLRHARQGPLVPTDPGIQTCTSPVKGSTAKVAESLSKCTTSQPLTHDSSRFAWSGTGMDAAVQTCTIPLSNHTYQQFATFISQMSSQHYPSQGQRPIRHICHSILGTGRMSVTVEPL